MILLFQAVLIYTGVAKNLGTWRRGTVDIGVGYCRESHGFWESRGFMYSQNIQKPGSLLL